MGYSYTAVAGYARETMIALLQSVKGDCGGSSNSWGDKEGANWFFEQGKEQSDGAITGTIFGPHPDGNQYAKKVGSVRIEPDGTVTRWPTSNAKQRQLARETAAAKMGAIHNDYRYMAPVSSGTIS